MYVNVGECPECLILETNTNLLSRKASIMVVMTNVVIVVMSGEKNDNVQADAFTVDMQTRIITCSHGQVASAYVKGINLSGKKTLTL